MTRVANVNKQSKHDARHPSQPIQKLWMLNRTTKSSKYKHMEKTTSREKRTQNAANPTGYSAMKTPQSIIGQQSPQTAHGPVGVPRKKTPKGNLITEGWGRLKFSACPTRWASRVWRKSVETKPNKYSNPIKVTIIKFRIKIPPQTK